MRERSFRVVNVEFKKAASVSWLGLITARDMLQEGCHQPLLRSLLRSIIVEYYKEYVEMTVSESDEEILARVVDAMCHSVKVFASANVIGLLQCDWFHGRERCSFIVFFRFTANFLIHFAHL